VVLWSGNRAEGEVEHALLQLGTSSLGEGELEILAAETNPTAEDGGLGSIEWLRFRVTLRWP
jgi:hypothetical protein